LVASKVAFAARKPYGFDSYDPLATTISSGEQGGDVGTAETVVAERRSRVENCMVSWIYCGVCFDVGRMRGGE